MRLTLAAVLWPIPFLASSALLAADVTAPTTGPTASRAAGATTLAAPELPRLDAKHWLNSLPLTLASLQGRPVLVEFWTFGCSRCTRRNSTASASPTRSRGRWGGWASLIPC
jgi:hypothetical protein